MPTSFRLHADQPALSQNNQDKSVIAYCSPKLLLI
jgi:hypothetical protein